VESHLSGSAGRTTSVLVGAVGGGRSADGEGGGYECADGVERVVCELAEVGKEEEGEAGSQQGGCCAPP